MSFAHRQNSSAVQPPSWQTALPRPAYRQYQRLSLDGPAWYEVYQIFPDVYAFYEPGHFQEVISFLIIGRDYALLWDTGMGFAPIKPLTAQLTSLPVLPVNSHHHFDHVGGNWEFPFVLSWPGPGSAQRAQAGYHHDFLAPMLGSDSFALPLPAGIDPASFHIRPWQPLFLDPQELPALSCQASAIWATASTAPATADSASGDTQAGRSVLAAAPPWAGDWPAATLPLHTGLAFDLGDRKLDILLTPGHTPDSIMLFDRRRRRLFTGDTLYPAALYAHFDSAEYGRSNLDIYSDTMHRLHYLVPYLDALCCSHNVPICPPALLGQAAAGFAAIQRGNCPSREDEDGLRRYDFDGFAVITK